MTNLNPNQTTIELTLEGYEEIVAELADLKEKQVKAVDRLALARSFGDLSENAEYHAAKEDLDFLNTRIEELETVVNQAKVIKESKAKTKVAVGGKVTVKSNGKTKLFHIVSAYEADPAEGKISNDSPIGKAFLGKKIGDTVMVEVPAGTLTYELLKIE